MAELLTAMLARFKTRFALRTDVALIKDAAGLWTAADRDFIALQIREKRVAENILGIFQVGRALPAADRKKLARSLCCEVSWMNLSLALLLDVATPKQIAQVTEIFAEAYAQLRDDNQRAVFPVGAFAGRRNFDDYSRWQDLALGAQKDMAMFTAEVRIASRALARLAEVADRAADTEFHRRLFADGFVRLPESCADEL